jgi:hypothetical protein
MTAGSRTRAWFDVMSSSDVNGVEADAKVDQCTDAGPASVIT